MPSVPRVRPPLGALGRDASAGTAGELRITADTSAVAAHVDPYEDVFQIPANPAGLESQAGREQVAGFLRRPEEPIEDLGYAHKYLTNLSRAMREEFLPALRSGQLSEGYADALRAQHRLLMDDYDGFYRGRPNADVEGGVFNFELPRGMKMLMMFDKPPAIAAELEAASPQYRYQLEGLPPAAWPRVMPGSRPSLLSPAKEQMPRVLQHLGDLLDTASRPLTPRDGFLKSLADYLYVGTLSQPFPRGNISLFMAHINVLLWERGMPMISVRDLDLKALRSTQAEFRDLFVEAVNAASR